jgi:endonuclease-3 related protein
MTKKHRKPHKTVLLDIYKTLYNTFGPQHWWPGETPFEVSVGAILTQNTNWTNVEKAIKNLKENNVLTAGKLHKLGTKKLASLIRPSGYFNVKAERLKSFLSYICSHYNGSLAGMKKGDTQTLRKELLSVNGIGPETADSILLYALDKPVFVIDAYTKRVLKRHSLASDDMTYHELQTLFHEALPVDVRLYNEYHALLVKLGKEFCRPKPKCEGCPLETRV